MQFVLPTIPAFLKKNFPQVRQSLGNPVAKEEFSVNHNAGKQKNVTIFVGDEVHRGDGVFSKTLATFTGIVREKAAQVREERAVDNVVDAQGEQTETLKQDPEEQTQSEIELSQRYNKFKERLQQSQILDTDTTTAKSAPMTTLAERAKTNIFKRTFSTMLTLITLGSILVGVFLFVPAAYYAFFPADVIEVTAPEEGTAFGGSFKEEEVVVQAPEPEEEKYVPPVDPTLPEGDWLMIPRIGVRSQLRPTEDPEEALAKGIWLVPDFGRPGDDELPMIAAAHRYGWKWWWKDDYWKYHSFYLLPDTEPGDRIEVISEQRKWVYEIYAGEEGDEITDYNADLILYTCKFLTGPVRHFRYARLIDPTTNTQQVGQVN